MLWLDFEHLPLDKILDRLETSAVEPKLRSYSHISVDSQSAQLHSKTDIPVYTAKTEDGFKNYFKSQVLKARDAPALAIH